MAAKFKWETPQSRFDDGHVKIPESGCWLWTGAWNEKKYGRLCINSKMDGAHRFSWALHNGPIPLGMYVLHKCDVPPCINPAHLFLGSIADNSADMVAKGRHYKSRATSCYKGHLYTDDSYVIGSRGDRVCKTCAVRNQEKWRAKLKQKTIVRKAKNLAKKEMKVMNIASQIASLRAAAEYFEARSHEELAQAFELERNYGRAATERMYAAACLERADNHRIDAAALGPNLAESGNQQQ